MAVPQINEMQQHVFSLIEKHLGLCYSVDRQSELQQSLREAIGEMGFTDYNDGLHQLVSSPWTPAQIAILAKYFTIGETFFFRDKPMWALLDGDILPTLIRDRIAAGNRRLRIWCAGVSTGEEAYTIAMLLSNMIANLAEWDLKILATDINPKALQHARDGVYREWAFRGITQAVKDRYFSLLDDGRYAISPKLKSLVTFLPLNLALDEYPSRINQTTDIDLLFCRNVFIYFSQDLIAKIINQFSQCLSNGGCLFVSPSETSMVQHPQLSLERYPETMLFRKTVQASTPRQPVTPNSSMMIPHQEPAHAATPREHHREPAPKAQPPIARLTSETSQPKTVSPTPVIQNNNGVQQPAQQARLLADHGNLREALIWCEAALAADKGNVANHFLRASILLATGALKEAGEALQRALYLDANFIMAHFTLAMIALQQQSPRSERYFDNARRLLQQCPVDAIIPESEGMTAAQLLHIIETMHGEQHRTPAGT